MYSFTTIHDEKTLEVVVFLAVKMKDLYLCTKNKIGGPSTNLDRMRHPLVFRDEDDKVPMEMLKSR